MIVADEPGLLANSGGCFAGFVMTTLRLLLFLIRIMMVMVKMLLLLLLLMMTYPLWSGDATLDM